MLCVVAQDEDQRARYFHFRRQRTELHWQQLCSVDLEALVASNDTRQLDRVGWRQGQHSEQVLTTQASLPPALHRRLAEHQEC